MYKRLKDYMEWRGITLKDIVAMTICLGMLLSTVIFGVIVLIA